MKAFLMYKDQDFDLDVVLPPNSSDVVQDLELNALFEAMARGDEFLFGVVKVAVLSSMHDPSAITYRQQILLDCIENQDAIRNIYGLAVEAIEGEGRIWPSYGKSPGSILYRSVQALELFFDVLKRLRQVAQTDGNKFRSEGFDRFFKMLLHELDDAYFREIEDHLVRLKAENDLVMSAELGKGNKASQYVLRRPVDEKRSWIEQIFGKKVLGYSFEIPPRDEAGHEALRNLRERGINSVANALMQSTDHILSFFTLLRIELGFYVGCLNLYQRLAQRKRRTCIPLVSTQERILLSAKGLYDVCLSLRLDGQIIGNDLKADNKRLVIITGANQGGKSTFLRSIGLAHLMMQCGMFVAADNFSASVCLGVYTHFKRKEDATMKSGKLDEELKRMSEIVDHVKPVAILLCNESFSSTNEREGSEIARQIITALEESGIRVFFVTFLFDFAQEVYEEKKYDSLFLRAERQPNGERTFKIVEGEPLSTGFGEDLYKRIFGSPRAQAAQIASSMIS